MGKGQKYKWGRVEMKKRAGRSVHVIVRPAPNGSLSRTKEAEMNQIAKLMRVSICCVAVFTSAPIVYSQCRQQDAAPSQAETPRNS
jgi:hypothetical protein